MANNVHQYGFRWVGSLDGGCCPKPQEVYVASAYQATVSATNVDLNIGDPVEFNHGTPDTGFVELAAVATGKLYGVIVGFSNVKVGLPLKGRKFSRLPGGTTWTTEENMSKVLVIPFGRNVWEIDCTVPGSNNTLAEYRALVNKNVDFSYTLDVTDADRPKANPMIDLSTVLETTAALRIVGVSKSQLNQDFSGSFVKMLVCVNETGEAPFTATP